MARKSWIAALVCTLGLAACGDTLGEQVIYGAGAGAAASAATGGDLATGAVVGGAANAAYCQSGRGNCR
ncbi:hypothetical protein [Poseidonocella pacifica]|uniref:hypothetical protein n=1 Tax=Poseidonocella pacifica TaxID=871651 RepID=UPI000B8893FB|nr:hypothetical protein [Poseidonocella pacifica]